MNTYEIVTQQIIGLLDSGVIPWHKPWRSEESAYNLISKKPYSMLNQMLLPSPGAYLSFNQIKDLGGRIKEGESPSRVCFFKIVEKKDASEDPETKERESYPILRYYNVWHVGQTEGIDPAKIPAPVLDGSLEADDDGEDVIMNYISRSGVTFTPRLSAKADYCVNTDTVTTPLLTQFGSVESYYGTVFHELVHSTGAKGRLERKLDGSYGSKEYAREELIAEIGSAMICSHLEMDTLENISNQAAYIAYWKERLASDPYLFVSAAGRAEKAARFILGEEVRTAA